MSLQVLLVDCFLPTPSGRRQYRKWRRAVTSSISALPTAEKANVLECPLDQLEQFCFDPANAARDYLAAVRRFDGLDFVVIDGDVRFLPWLPEARLLLHFVRLCVVTDKCLLACGPAAYMLGFVAGKRSMREIEPALLPPAPECVRRQDEQAVLRLRHRKLIAYDTGEVYVWTGEWDEEVDGGGGQLHRHHRLHHHRRQRRGSSTRSLALSVLSQSISNYRGPRHDEHEHTKLMGLQSSRSRLSAAASSAVSASSSASSFPFSSAGSQRNRGQDRSKWRRVSSVGMKAVGCVTPQYRGGLMELMNGPLKLEEWSCRIRTKYLHHFLFESLPNREFVVARSQCKWVLDPRGRTDAERGYIVLAESEESPQVIVRGNAVGFQFRIDDVHESSVLLLRSYLKHKFEAMRVHGRLCKWLSREPSLLPVRGLREPTSAERRQEEEESKKHRKSAFEFLMSSDGDNGTSHADAGDGSGGGGGSNGRDDDSNDDDDDATSDTSATESSDASDDSSADSSGNGHSADSGRMRITVDDFKDSALPPPASLLELPESARRQQRRSRKYEQKRRQGGDGDDNDGTAAVQAIDANTLSIRLPPSPHGADSGERHQQPSQPAKLAMMQQHQQQKQKRNKKKQTKQLSRKRSSKKQSSLYGMKWLSDSRPTLVQRQRQRIKQDMTVHGDSHTRSMPSLKAMDEFFGVQRAVDEDGTPHQTQAERRRQTRLDTFMRTLSYTQFSKAEIFALQEPPHQIHHLRKSRSVKGPGPLWNMKTHALRDASQAKLQQLRERDWYEQLDSFEPQVKKHTQSLSAKHFARTALQWRKRNAAARRHSAKVNPSAMTSAAASTGRLDEFLRLQREQARRAREQLRARQDAERAEYEDTMRQYKLMRGEDNQAEWQLASAVYFMNKRMEQALHSNAAADKDKSNQSQQQQQQQQQGQQHQVEEDEDDDDGWSSGGEQQQQQHSNNDAQPQSSAVDAEMRRQMKLIRQVQRQRRLRQQMDLPSAPRFSKAEIRRMLHPSLLEGLPKSPRKEQDGDEADAGAAAADVQELFVDENDGQSGNNASSKKSTSKLAAVEREQQLQQTLAEETARAIAAAQSQALVVDPSMDRRMFVSATSGIDYSSTPAVLAMSKLGKHGSGRTGGRNRRHASEGSRSNGGPQAADVARASLSPIVVRKKVAYSPLKERLARTQPRLLSWYGKNGSQQQKQKQKRKKNKQQQQQQHHQQEHRVATMKKSKRWQKRNEAMRQVKSLASLMQSMPESSPMRKALQRAQSTQQQAIAAEESYRRQRKARRDVLRSREQQAARERRKRQQQRSAPLE